MAMENILEPMYIYSMSRAKRHVVRTWWQATKIDNRREGSCFEEKGADNYGL